MNAPKEITIKVKDDTFKLSQKYLEYRDFTMSFEDPLIQDMVHDTLERFSGDGTELDITISIKMDWGSLPALSEVMKGSKATFKLPRSEKQICEEEQEAMNA